MQLSHHLRLARILYKRNLTCKLRGTKQQQQHRKILIEDEKFKNVVFRLLFTRFNAKFDIIDYIKYHH